ncbi:hypothetical protein PLUA15_170006 [Pseudomonas lundensis]|uniref:Uncharacterized protein n=1 Tax=Pseudomonas lundensis TaxID=86185 RepID=A0AAX2H4J8_9PSED|nr:hypothetical protein PLUA15_170006 [Pseudomonas lundensis]
MRRYPAENPPYQASRYPAKARGITPEFPTAPRGQSGLRTNYLKHQQALDAFQSLPLGSPKRLNTLRWSLAYVPFPPFSDSGSRTCTPSV